ncbi:MAG TPA: hypothetical protein VMH37_14790 [Candidatus Binataceae bacterium]|nr:hypothetical protein [Candidatus Binataceae bacterium]
MATISERQTTLRFSGTPSRLECIAHLARPAAGRASIALKLGGRLGDHRSNLHLLRVQGSESVRMRFALPPVTPAGSYRGAAHVDDREIPVVVEVQPRAGLTVSPSSFSVEASSGGESSLALTLLNLGNVPCEIGKAYVFRLFDNNSYDHALAAALKDDGEKGRARVDRFIDEFVSAGGGNVRVAVEDGAGVIQPGEQRELTLKLKFPDHLGDDRGYYGYITMHNLHFCVNVHVGARHGRASR